LGKDIVEGSPLEDVREEIEIANRDRMEGQGGPDCFKPGNIHDPKFFKFWKEVLKASPWVLNIIENGYKLPFTSEPPRYEEKNNASARAEEDVVRELVEEMIG